MKLNKKIQQDLIYKIPSNRREHWRTLQKNLELHTPFGKNYVKNVNSSLRTRRLQSNVDSSKKMEFFFKNNFDSLYIPLKLLKHLYKEFLSILVLWSTVSHRNKVHQMPISNFLNLFCELNETLRPLKAIVAFFL